MCDNLSQIAQLDDQTVLASFEPEAKSGGYQSEAQMEEGFIKILQAQGYEYTGINTEAGLLQNLRACVEDLNRIKFTDAEWQRWLSSRLLHKTKLEKAHIIQDGSTAEAFQFDDGAVKNLKLLDKSTCSAQDPGLEPIRGQRGQAALRRDDLDKRSAHVPY